MMIRIRVRCVSRDVDRDEHVEVFSLTRLIGYPLELWLLRNRSFSPPSSCIRKTGNGGSHATLHAGTAYCLSVLRLVEEEQSENDSKYDSLSVPASSSSPRPTSTRKYRADK